MLVKLPCENSFQAILTYESGRKTGELLKDLHRLGKALARGSDFKTILGAAMNCPGLKRAIEDFICSEVNGELKKVCSKKAASLYDRLQRIAFSIFPGKQLVKNWLKKHHSFIACS